MNWKSPSLSLRPPYRGIFSSSHQKYFLVFCIFWIFVAFLEFGQDYISALLNGNTFIIGESLSYKLFWLLFIPFCIALDQGIAKAGKVWSGPFWIAGIIIQILTVTFLHLMVFSLMLFGISFLMHDDPISLLFLLYEKLSNRLYIALSIYTVFPMLAVFINHLWMRRELGAKNQSKTLTVKNGKSTVLIATAEIMWISSDRAYLDIHTENKTHVVLGSLKNIIQKLPDNFKRIHRSTIVDMERIEKLHSRGNGDYDVFMGNGKTLRLSRNYAKDLKKSCCRANTHLIL